MSSRVSFQVAWLTSVLWALAAGCTVNPSNTSNAADNCSIDSAVSCQTGTGYSCTGAPSPQDGNSSLSCGAGVGEADGDTGYCCQPESSAACAVDTSAGCTGGSTGYACPGSDSPVVADPSLACGAGVTGNDGETRYCCVTSTTSSCAPDATVAGCSAGSYGFSCSSTDTPSDGNGALNCSTPVADSNGVSLYCCVGFTTSGSSCTADSSVAGCAGGSYGFSCTSTDTPDQAQPSLSCSTPVTGPNSELLYCCSNE
ncbi:MAG: hypothetical protein ABI488_26270 [Polyangiaceae bacterium]